MSATEIAAVWTGIVLVVGIIVAGLTMSSLYAPRPAPLSALDQCAQYEQSRNSIFCYELVKNQPKQ